MPFRVYTSSAVREMDRHTIDSVGVPSAVLMEVAGRAVAEELVVHWKDACASGVLVVAGKGNNGGDGWVVARYLHQHGIAVEVLSISGVQSGDCARNESIARGLGVPVVDPQSASPCGLIVDALLGTGGSGALRGEAAERVSWMNSHAAPVLSIDLPSGVCGDTGRVVGPAVRAQATLSLGFAKSGLFGATSSEYVGAIRVLNIGLVGPQEPLAEVVCGSWVDQRLPRRAAGGHKGQSGRLVVLAGSREKAGAAVLCSNAALAMGCGLVTLVVPAEASHRLEGLGPEVMVEFSDEPTTLDWSRFTAAAVGPGFGLDSGRAAILRELYQALPLPAVFDADGLTALGSTPGTSRYPRCLTPHPGEAARLLGLSSGEVQEDRWAAIQRLRALAPCLLKGRYSLIAEAVGRVRVNMTGSSALSTAGSGDVLTGMSAALLAQEVEPLDALTMASYLHGWVASRSGRSRLSASELVAGIGPALDAVGQSEKPLSAKSVIGP